MELSTRKQTIPLLYMFQTINVTYDRFKTINTVCEI